MDLFRFYISVPDKNGLPVGKPILVDRDELIRRMPTITESEILKWPHIHVNV